MERFIAVAGDIIVVSFPFTDLSTTRKRPALVLSNFDGDDIVICEITSKIKKDNYAVSLENKDLESGSLKMKSTIRLLTIHKSKINYKFGEIKKEKLEETLAKLKIVFNLK